MTKLAQTLREPAPAGATGMRRTHERFRSDRRSLLRRVEGEFREMPGLCLTLRQAQRLWHLDQQTCRMVLSTLVERGFLKRTEHGMYVRFRG